MVQRASMLHNCTLATGMPTEHYKTTKSHVHYSPTVSFQ